MTDDFKLKTSSPDLEHVKYEMAQEISALRQRKRKEKEAEKNRKSK